MYTQNGQLYVTGSVDSINGLVAYYPNSLLQAPSTMRYTDHFTDDFTDEIDYMGFTYGGGGSLDIVVDGYGTLKLPNHTYNNVLRAKQTSTEIDTVQGQEVTTRNTAYVWFDTYHAAALLTIDSATLNNSPKLSAYYLKSELLSVRTDIPVNEMSMYPNPSNTQVSIEAKEKGVLTILDMTGKRMGDEIAIHEGKNIISTDILSNGMYLLQMNTEQGIEFSKLEVRH
jgi:hypothetical protein